MWQLISHILWHSYTLYNIGQGSRRGQSSPSNKISYNITLCLAYSRAHIYYIAFNDLLIIQKAHTIHCKSFIQNNKTKKFTQLTNSTTVDDSFLWVSNDQQKCVQKFLQLKTILSTRNYLLIRSGGQAGQNQMLNVTIINKKKHFGLVLMTQRKYCGKKVKLFYISRCCSTYTPHIHTTRTKHKPCRL